MSSVGAVSAALGLTDGAVRETRPGELLLQTTQSSLPDFADRITDRLSGRLLSLFASDERAASGRFSCTTCGRCEPAVIPPGRGPGASEVNHRSRR